MSKTKIVIFTGLEGLKAYHNKYLLHPKIEFCLTRFKHFRYLERMIYALSLAFTWKDRNCIVYTASDFWHDFFVGLIIKLRFPSVKWVAGYYLIAPFPLRKDNPYKKWAKVRGIGYWLSQRPTLFLVNRYADKIFITSEPDRKYFRKPTIVVQGGVNIPQKVNILPKIYDAVFVGRLHYQKGIKELLDIWKLVQKSLSTASLVIIGDGVLRKLVLKSDLPYICRVGFANDAQKEWYFRSSRIILHPAIFDSGGMSCAEGMAYGLPAVGFDLEVFKTYYPRGMLKAKNNKEFAQHIINLLAFKELYERISIEARDLIKEEWDWDRRAQRILKEII